MARTPKSSQPRDQEEVERETTNALRVDVPDEETEGEEQIDEEQLS
jgi:hypothetical protein